MRLSRRYQETGIYGFEHIISDTQAEKMVLDFLAKRFPKKATLDCWSVANLMCELLLGEEFTPDMLDYPVTPDEARSPYG